MNSKLVTIARLLHARGNKGELAALPLCPDPQKVQSVIVNQTPMQVERVWMHGDRVIFKFQGVDTISDAERLAGADVSIPMEQREAPPEGEYYRSDLIGCEVADSSGGPLGTVESWQETGAVPIVTVRTPQGAELLIPFAKSIFLDIDIERRRIRVALPDGLLDLN